MLPPICIGAREAVHLTLRGDTTNQRRAGIVCASAALLALASNVVIGIFGQALSIFYIAYAAATFCCIVLWLLAPDVPPWRISRKWALVGVACLALGLRIFFLIKGPLLSFDASWYADYIRFFTLGRAPYTEFYFPYPQGFADFLFLFVPFAHPTAILRCVFLTLDSALAVALFVWWSERATTLTAALFAISYAMFPMSALETARNGHFEILISVLVFVLVHALRRKQALVAAAVIALATSIKVFPALLLPSLIATWSSRRKAIVGLVTFLGVSALISYPFVHTEAQVAALSAALFPSGAQGGDGAFFANSLAAAAHDLQFLSWILPAAKMCLALVMLLLLVEALSAARTWKPAASASKSALRFYARINATGISFRFSSVFGDQASLKIGFFIFFAFMSVYGLYLTVDAFQMSSLAWFTPAPVVFGRGVALIGVAVIALWYLLKRSLSFGPLPRICVLMAVAITLIIVTHANVNPWYLLPVVTLLLLCIPSRLAILGIACMAIYYASYATSSFTSMGYNDVIAWAHAPAVSIDRGPDQRNLVDVALQGEHTVAGLTSLIYPIRGDRKSARQYVAIKPPLNCKVDQVAGSWQSAASGAADPFTAPVVGGYAIFEITSAGSDTGTLALQIDRACAPKVWRRNERSAIASAHASSKSLEVSMNGDSGGLGWAQIAEATYPLFGYAYPNSALAFTMQTDVDPTFHSAPFSLAVFVSGSNTSGEVIKRLPLLQGDSAATSLGSIELRLPLVPVDHLNVLKSATFQVAAIARSRKPHVFTIRNIRLVNESVNDVWTLQVALLVGVVIILQLIVVASLMIRLQSEHPVEFSA